MHDTIRFSISCIQVLDRSLALVALTQSSQKKTDKVRNVGVWKIKKKAFLSSKRSFKL